MRTEYDQQHDIKVAIAALNKQFSMISREYQSIYTLRKISSVRNNILQMKQQCLFNIQEYLETYSVYDSISYDDENSLQKIQTKLYWSINALDGIQNFIHKIPLVSSSIDLVNSVDHSRILSVVFCPLVKELIVCADGLGCSIEHNRTDYGRRYVSTEINQHTYIALGDDVHVNKACNNALNLTAQNDHRSYINLNNDTMCIAYVACGYISGGMINSTASNLAVSKLFMKESNGIYKTQNNMIYLGYSEIIQKNML